MSLPSKSEALAILQRVLSFAKADETQVNLAGGHGGNLRFARNAVSTSGGADVMSLAVQSTSVMGDPPSTMLDFTTRFEI